MIPCSVVSLFISWNIALMVNEETVLVCTSVAEKQVTVFTEPYSGSALLSVFRAIMTPVNFVAAMCRKVILAKAWSQHWKVVLVAFDYCSCQ